MMNNSLFGITQREEYQDEAERFAFVEQRDGHVVAMAFAAQIIAVYISAICDKDGRTMASAREHRDKFIASVHYCEGLFNLPLTDFSGLRAETPEGQADYLTRAAAKTRLKAEAMERYAIYIEEHQK